MKCKYCEEVASVIYTKIIGDKSHKSHLCAKCADEQGVTSLDQFDLSDLLMYDEPIISAREKSKMNTNECPECGFTRENLRKIGRLGCSSCYDVFGDELNRMITTMHKGIEHKGKVPTGMLQVIEAKTKLKILQTKLDYAIENEDYEMAGKLKNELAAFQKSLPLDVEGVR